MHLMTILSGGGMPQRFMQKDDISRKTYLNDIYDSIIIKDIVKRFNIKDIDLLNRIVTYILTIPSQVFSPDSLKNICKVILETFLLK